LVSRLVGRSACLLVCRGVPGRRRSLEIFPP
jgi:hypothetical protein